MRFSFNSGFKDFGDKRVHFNELEIFVNSYVDDSQVPGKDIHHVS